MYEFVAMEHWTKIVIAREAYSLRFVVHPVIWKMWYMFVEKLWFMNSDLCGIDDDFEYHSPSQSSIVGDQISKALKIYVEFWYEKLTMTLNLRYI